MMKSVAMFALACTFALSDACGAWKMDTVLVREDFETEKTREGSPEIFSGLIAPGLLVETRQAAFRTKAKETVESTTADLRIPADDQKAFARSFRIYSFGRREHVASKLVTEFLFAKKETFDFSVEHDPKSENFVCVCSGKRLEVPCASLPAEFLFTANRRGEAELAVKGLGDSRLYHLKFPAPRFEWSVSRPVKVLTTFRSQEPDNEAEIVLDELLTGTAVQAERSAFSAKITPMKTFDPDKAGWKKVFEDDFNGTELDMTKWTLRHPNPEGLLKIADGELRIGCDFTPGCTNRVSKNLRTAEVMTRENYRFGYFEARVRFTRQNGWWAAFWLYGTKNANPFTEGFEIDIFEDFYTRRRDKSGKLFNMIDHNLHLYCGSMKALKSWNYNSEIPGGPDEWYDVGCKWTPFEISCYINGKLISSRAWHSPWESVTFDAFNHGCGTVPLHAILSGEIMKSQWNSDTQDVTGCTFPDWYRIDRVRIYEYPETGTRAPRVSWKERPVSGSEGEVGIGADLIFRANANPASSKGLPLKAVYLFDSGYPLQCCTNPPYEFRVPFDEAYYRTTRYMEPGRQNQVPSFDVPHAFQLFAQDSAGNVGFSEPLVIKPVPKTDVEPPYAFRTRLLEIHQKNRRDPTLKPEADEFEFKDGCTVPNEDFAGYLKTSMGVRATVSKKGSAGGVAVRLSESLAEREYVINVAKKGVAILARDGRAAAQALYHLEDLMNLRRAPFLKVGKEKRRMKFSPRMTHTGYALDEFPDEHLATIAHAGFDAILFYVMGPDRTEGGKDDLADLIDRAAKWGLDAYLYSSLSAKRHPDDPESDAEMARVYGSVVKRCKNAKGVLIVPESCYFESRDPRVRSKTRQTDEKGKQLPDPSRYPCSDYPQWLAKIEKTVRAEIPDADVIFWTYNFYWTPEKERFAFIDGVSPATTLNVSFALGDWHEHPTRLGHHFPVNDYSICEPGPSALFRTEAKHAHERGLKLFTTCNTGGRTWDFGCAPYEPVPQQWKRRFDALVKAQDDFGLSGLIESHHYGFVPNFVAELAKESFTEGGLPFEEHLMKIAARDFGKRHADETVAIWADLSEAIKDYVPTSQNQWGPFRVGPAYPFNVFGPFLKYKDPDGWPNFNSWICNPNYGWSIPWGGGTQTRVALNEKAHRIEIELFNSAGERFVAAGRKLRAFADELDGERRARARREAGVVEYIGRSFFTCANVKAAALAERAVLDEKSSEADRAEAKAEVQRLAEKEYANTAAALPLVEADSLLGWECKNLYMGGRERLVWKLLQMEKLYNIGK
ncbi:MAG: glycoside hydrolase family 16 protein [Kiritimatiellae bacterium]|nr:glycoside hydrolase family 16 protein [Kiritimatiellia bacterium]